MGVIALETGNLKKGHKRERWGNQKQSFSKYASKRTQVDEAVINTVIHSAKIYWVSTVSHPALSAEDTGVRKTAVISVLMECTVTIDINHIIEQVVN